MPHLLPVNDCKKKSDFDCIQNETNPRHKSQKGNELKTHQEDPANKYPSQKNAATGKRSFRLPAFTFFMQKQMTTWKRGTTQQKQNRRDREMTPKVKWSPANTNWPSLTNGLVFYVLVIPRTPEHKRPSVVCAALMNRSTSSAKSKTRGHGRHHCWFVNR